MPEHQHRGFTPRPLRAIKFLHTVVWAVLAGCVLAIQVAAWRGDFLLAAWLVGIVALEVAVLAGNRGRCPLTSIAARYTEDRRENFDIYLPRWIAKHNKLIFGTLYVVGTLFAIARWTGALS